MILKPVKFLIAVASNIVMSPLIIVGIVTVALYYAVILTKHSFRRLAELVKRH